MELEKGTNEANGKGSTSGAWKGQQWIWEGQKWSLVRVAVELENGSSEAGGKTVGEVQEVVPLKGISKAREGQQKVGKGSSGAL